VGANHCRDIFLKTPSTFSDFEQINRLPVVKKYEEISGYIKDFESKEHTVDTN
jgi:cephalosporin-C deacetylase-like acetyl esterase